MRARGKFLASIVSTFFLLTILAAAAFAVPPTINYQGYIEGSGGSPVNGTLSMTFAIYNAPTGGSALWSENQSTVNVNNGAFSVVLGSVTPITLPFDEQYYLGVTVDADAEMTPRAVLVSVPYAMRAGSADTAVSAETAITLGDKTLSQIVSLLDQRYGVGNVLAADFSADNTSIYSNEIVNFTDLSLGVPIQWNWDFGDSSSSSLKNPSYTYTTPGIYTVSLTIQDGLTSDTKSVTDYITVNEIAPDFSAAPRTIYTNQSVNFTDLTQGVPISWSWDFGDTGTDTIQNPQHMYTAPGSYTVALTVDDGVTIKTATKPDYITVSEITPDFTVDETAISVNETVNFTDWTHGVPISWSWDFGDTGTSTLQNPSHQYTSDGTFTVSLTADDGLNSNTETKVDYITVYPFPRSSTTTVVSTDNVGQYSSIAIGSDGLPGIAYYNTTTSDLEFVHCGDVSCLSGNTTKSIDSTGSVGYYASIVNGADGRPMIAYLDMSHGYLKVAHCGDAACSVGKTIITVDSAGGVGYSPSIAIGSDGLPVISYHDNWNYDLKVVHCGNAFCSSGNTITTVDSTGNVGSYTSIAIGADGRPVISYLDSTNYDLKVVRCGDTLCESGNIITTVDSTGNVGLMSSIAVGIDDMPIISYYDSTNQDLKILHCGDASCTPTTNTINVLDSGNYTGQYTSIAIGTDGLPVISYYDLGYGDLKVVHCGDASCSSGNTISKVHSPEYDGKYTSIAIGSDGLPVISYYDETNGDLKAAHCTDVACTLWP